MQYTNSGETPGASRDADLDPTQRQHSPPWLDTRATVTLTELACSCNMTEADLNELVEYGALVPLMRAAPERAFSAEWAAPLRNAAKLRVDYDLDLFTVAILLGNLLRIEVLERQVHALQAVMPAPLYSGMGFQQPVDIFDRQAP